MATHAEVIQSLDRRGEADLANAHVCRDGMTIECLRLAVLTSDLLAYAIWQDGERVGTMTVYVDGSELVVQGLSGVSGRGLVDDAMLICHRLAFRARCRSIRAHCRPGMARVLLSRRGIHEVSRAPGEIVVRLVF